MTMDKMHGRARWIALLAVTAIALYLCWSMLQPFINVILWAAVFVIIVYPANRWFVKKTKSPVLSAWLSILLVIVAIILPLAFITTAAVNELTTAAKYLHESFQTLSQNATWGPKIQKAYDYLKEHINFEQVFKKTGQTVFQGTTNIIGGAVGMIMNACFVVLAMFYMFRDSEKIRKNLPGVLPLESSQSEEILGRTRDIINASLYGVLVIAMIQGVLGGGMFWILGISSALLWGVMMTLLSIIPMLGTFIVWIPAAIYLALTGHWAKALVLVVWGALVIGTVDNVLRPKLVGERARMHELFVFFSVLGGLKVFGILGFLLGPIVLAVAISLLNIFMKTDDAMGRGA
jgi:predicted PurR-regulated permease PerM